MVGWCTRTFLSRSFVYTFLLCMLHCFHNAISCCIVSVMQYHKKLNWPCLRHFHIHNTSYPCHAYASLLILLYQQICISSCAYVLLFFSYLTVSPFHLKVPMIYDLKYWYIHDFYFVTGVWDRAVRCCCSQPPTTRTWCASPSMSCLIRSWSNFGVRRRVSIILNSTISSATAWRRSMKRCQIYTVLSL